MALTGTYTRTLDDKRRLAIPKRFREDFGEDDLRVLYLAPGTDRSLMVYAPGAFARLAERLSQKSTNRSEIRNYLRLFYSQAEKVELDGQGRICIPDRLADFARLNRETVLLGVHDHAEIWEAAVWQEFLERTGPDFDSMASHALD